MLGVQVFYFVQPLVNKPSRKLPDYEQQPKSVSFSIKEDFDNELELVLYMYFTTCLVTVLLYLRVPYVIIICALSMYIFFFLMRYTDKQLFK